MAKDAKPRKTTEYVVLGQDKSGYWQQLDSHEDGTTAFHATNAVEAMKAGAARTTDYQNQEEGPVRFVAIPARSWKPMQRTVEQVTKETWS